MSEEKLQRYYKFCRKYFDKLGEKKFKDWFLKYYVFLCNDKMSKVVLDVGCGAGQVVHKLAEVGSFSVGIDLSPIAINLAVFV